MKESSVLIDLQTTLERLDHARQVLELSITFPRAPEAFPEGSHRLAAFTASRLARDERRYELEIQAIKLTLRLFGFKQHEMAEGLKTIDVGSILVKAVKKPDGTFDTQTFSEREEENQ